jgi:hypothetical protein
MIRIRTHGQKYTSKREFSWIRCDETKNLFRRTDCICYQQNVGLIYISLAIDETGKSY